jgi:hypothetical protein
MSELKTFINKQKKLVAKGKLSKSDATALIFDKAIQMLQDLKMPETDSYLDGQAKDNEYQMNNFN